MSELIQQFDDMLTIHLQRGPQPPPKEQVREAIEELRGLPTFCSISDSEAEDLRKAYISRHSVSMMIGSAVTGAAYEPWFNAKQSELDMFFWDRYKKYLLLKKHYSNDVTNTMDQESSQIVDYLQNPETPGSWDRRGLVMGHVQSGKTSNYTGVINKAADAGYKVIIVIAGVNNNLRNQTQIRIDEGFRGFDYSKKTLTGVGHIDPKRRPGAFTTSLRDFNKATATGMGIPLQNMNEPAFMVIKKNPGILKNVIDWLKDNNIPQGTKKITEPMLLIDDEADNASINTKYSKDEVTKINGQIRSLLALFERSCYVGYTATPFANVFIHPDSDDEMLEDDLFPRDFIRDLNPPANYVGPGKVFLSKDPDILCEIDDNQDLLPVKHKPDHVVQALPQSLKRAIRQFVIARALRLSRGQSTFHSSMMVNTSIYRDVQSRLRNLIHQELVEIQMSAKINGNMPFGKAIKDDQIEYLHKIWEQDFTDSGKDWSEIQEILNTSAAPIVVREINSKSKDVLNYGDYEKDGLSVIAVGGYALSRGMTLEGLTTSYYLRNSIMSDTLMQMGRWFGYRDGYEDLCRVWMPDEAIGHYEFIAETGNQFRGLIQQMQAAGATPRDFGLRVRSHPDVLLITARNKMGSARTVDVDIRLGAALIETHILKRDPGSLSQNHKAAKGLVNSLAEAGISFKKQTQSPYGYLAIGVKADNVLSFLSAFDNHEASYKTYPEPVIRYIRDRLDSEEPELSEWDVFIPSRSKPLDDESIDSTLGLTINLQERTAGTSVVNKDLDLKLSSRQRVGSRGVVKAGLTGSQIKKADTEWQEKFPELKNPPDHIYGKVRGNPLLMLHMIKVKEKDHPKPLAHPVVAWGISFPETEQKEITTRYVVNTTWWNNELGVDQYEEDLENDED